MLSENIFRAYDIRGVYDSELNAETIRNIGKAFAVFIAKKYNISNPKIIIGKDNRTHGEELQAALIEGLMDQGAEVSRVEDCPSPMLYFTVCSRNYDGGINVTASHNSAEYNGCKLLGRNAHSIAGDEIQDIKDLILEDNFEMKEGGTITDTEISEQYYKKICSIITMSKPLKIVIDAGNGVAGKYYPQLFRKLGCDVIELYCEQDGRFPNHEPDPVIEKNTTDLKKIVLKENADLGISFDGDGDRFAIIDEKGKYHDANETFVLLIQDITKRHPESPVIYTVSNSLIIPEEVKKYGGSSLMVPVGHSHVEQAMTSTGALLGGEQSGHFFVSENYYGFDDAAYVSAKLLSIFSQSEKTISEHYDGIPIVFTGQERRPHCEDERKFKVIEAVKHELSEKYTCNTLDGIRAEFEDGGWLGIRASNTSPCLSVCTESRTQEGLEKIEKVARDVLSKHGISLKSE